MIYTFDLELTIVLNNVLIFLVGHCHANKYIFKKEQIWKPEIQIV